MLDFNTYIGIPFKAFGRDSHGLDCWGLVRLIYKHKLDIDLPSYINEYDGIEDRDKIAKAMEKHAYEWLEISSGNEQIFDVILMRIRGLPIHVGIVIAPGRMLHILSNMNVCLERYNTTLWHKRIQGFYRYAR